MIRIQVNDVNKLTLLTGVWYRLLCCRRRMELKAADSYCRLPMAHKLWLLNTIIVCHSSTLDGWRILSIANPRGFTELILSGVQANQWRGAWFYVCIKKKFRKLLLESEETTLVLRKLKNKKWNMNITGSCCRDNALTNIVLTLRTTLKPVQVAPF